MTPAAFVRPAWEVADVIRQHGAAFLSARRRACGHAAEGAARPGGAAAPPRWAATSSAASTAGTNASPTTPAATGTVPSARPSARAAGWSAKPRTCCRSSIPRGLHAARRSRGPGPGQPDACSTICCFRRRRRRCARWRPTRSIWERQVGVLMVLHTWGQNLQHHPHVHASSPAAACRAMPRATIEHRRRGCRAGRASSCRCGCSSRVFRGKYLDGLRQAFARGPTASSGRARRHWPMPRRFSGLATPLVRKGLGGVRQAALRRTRAGAEVPGPLHAPRGHQQLAAGRNWKRAG